MTHFTVLFIQSLMNGECLEHDIKNVERKFGHKITATNFFVKGVTFLFTLCNFDTWHKIVSSQLSTKLCISSERATNFGEREEGRESVRMYGAGGKQVTKMLQHWVTVVCRENVMI